MDYFRWGDIEELFERYTREDANIIDTKFIIINEDSVAEKADNNLQVVNYNAQEDITNYHCNGSLLTCIIAVIAIVPFIYMMFK